MNAMTKVTAPKSGKPRHPKADEMRRLYSEGVARQKIAIVLGVTEWVVRHYTQDIPKAKPFASEVYLTKSGKLLPVGKLGLTKALTPEQVAGLGDLAIKWKCQSLAEAALELIRDGLEEVA